jgi:hypothetical protein
MAEYPADMNQLLLSAALRYRTRSKPGFVVEVSQETAGTRGAMSASVDHLFTKEHRSSLLAETNDALALLLQGKKARKRAHLQQTLPQFNEGISQGIGLRAGRAGRGSVVAATPSNPLAFLSSGDDATPDELAQNRRLKPIAVTAAEKFSQLRDGEVVQTLLAKVDTSMQSRRASIQVGGADDDDHADDDADAMRREDEWGAAAVREARKSVREARKSVHQANIETLQAALEEESLAEPSCLNLAEESSYHPVYPKQTGLLQPCDETRASTSSPVPVRGDAQTKKSSNRILGWLEA